MKFSKYNSILLTLIMTASCATSSNVMDSSVDKVRGRSAGTLITVNLDTNGKVREDKTCYLNIQSESNTYKLPLKRGIWDYSLSLENKTPSSKAEIVKISCGPFYYYDLDNQGADFKVSDSSIKYLGIVNFKFEDKGKLEWGHATKNSIELQRRLRLMGLPDTNVELDLLKL